MEKLSKEPLKFKHHTIAKEHLDKPDAFWEVL